MAIIEKVFIHEFRKFKNLNVMIGDKITAIAGKNGTMKTTLLGIIGQPFSMNDIENPMCKEKAIDGTEFSADLNDKFKFSPLKDQAGHHRWDVYFYNKDILDALIYPVNSIVRSQKTGRLRFWHATNRTKGSGFRTLPVIYLSLQRLSPLGESKKEEFDSTVLTQEEKTFINEYHNKILCTTSLFIESGIASVSTSKFTIAHTTATYDAYGISAGQDNVGRILLAILSFKRLKEKFPTTYKGGLLLIDELDATMYPAAQEKLTEVLFRFASDFNLQIVFTTHSMCILEKLKENKYEKDSEIVYLFERGGFVENHPNPSVLEMKSHLNAVARNPENEKKIKVYCEDDVGRFFLKSLLSGKIKSKLTFDSQSVSAEHYHVFLDKKIQEFTTSLIVLDGDKKTKSGRGSAKKNIVILPPNCIPTPIAPETLFYRYLFSLSDTDEFWSTELDGHTKDTCFRDFPIDPKNIAKYKQWYFSQKACWGRACIRLHKRWIKDNPLELSRFRKDFIISYNHLAKSLEYELLSEDLAD